ncbi:sensor histidine kinase [Maribacter sp. 2307UL18-2]|uniref:sensor histidine kinase n=1 Tax=Maribacter sp. 2307UL18-2 TaxID=3386274 RepID=UPI0039BCA5BE
MKKVPFKILAYLILCGLFAPAVLAQSDAVSVQGFFNMFKASESSEERFVFFFNTPNRYNENSAYDWLEAVNVYLNNSEKTKDSLAITHYKLVQSQIHHDLGDYDKSLAIAKELYANERSLGDDTRATLFELMDVTYSKLELYAKQMEIRKEKRELGLTENIAFYDIYSNLGLHRDAMKDYFENEKKNVSEKDYYGQAVFWNNVGTFLRLDKSYPTSLSNYKKAHGFINVYLNDVITEKSEKQETESKVLRAIIDGNIGKCHVLLKQYTEALPYLERSIDSIKVYNAGKYSTDLVENKLEIALCYLQLEDFEKATDYLSDGTRPIKLENVLKKNRLLASYYDKTDNFATASEYYKRNMRIRDSVEENKSDLWEKQLAAVVGEDKANAQRMMEEQRAALEKSRSDMIAKDEKISLVFISLIFTLLGFAGLVYAYLKSIKNQRLIAEQKHIIENSLVEKDSLLKEIHHRVKNNLQMVSSLLSLQTKNTRSKAAIEALEEGKSRVKAMALIHQKLYQHDDLSVIEMQGYIESLINSVQSVYKKGGHNINITVDAEDVELDIDRAIPFGLILNELVSNSFKYAFPKNEDNGKIYIHLRKIANQDGFFEYTDNGVGLPEDTDQRTNASMGIRLMNRLVNQLQSKLNIDKTSEGVRFWFNFK